MITVDEADRIIAEQAHDLGVETIPLHRAPGRILREKIIADRDFPPYDRVTMDGIAIMFSSYAEGTRNFPVEGVAAAGDLQHTLKDPKNCLEIMTGASMPRNADTVIPYEQITLENRMATVDTDTVIEKQNVHFRGLDRKSGEQILSPGIKLASGEIGVCATVGRSQIRVSKLPTAMVLSSGDELVDIDEEPLPHQIRKSNVHRILSSLGQLKIEANHDHLEDDRDMIRERLEKYLISYDLLMISGGVSKGKFDYLPDVLEELGVEKLFHRIRQRPGKPFWFGRYDRVPVFAFPGNPVSSFMCMQRYFIPWLTMSTCQENNHQPFAELTEDVVFKPDLTYFLEVGIRFDTSGKICAIPKKGHGSGDLANLVNTDAFMELPMGRDTFKKGESYPVLIYRDLF